MWLHPCSLFVPHRSDVMCDKWIALLLLVCFTGVCHCIVQIVGVSEEAVHYNPCFLAPPCIAILLGRIWSTDKGRGLTSPHATCSLHVPFSCKTAPPAPSVPPVPVDFDADNERGWSTVVL